MFGIGPTYLFVCNSGFRSGCWRWLAALAQYMTTNFGIALVVATLIWLVGVDRSSLCIAITLIAGAIGVWLFFVQHQFDQTFWAREGEWTLHEAACMAARTTTCAVLRWFTANMGCIMCISLQRIPYYRLPSAARSSGVARCRG